VTRSEALILAARLASCQHVRSARVLIRRHVPADGRVISAIETHRTPPTGDPNHNPDKDR
jgi:hypothetical protein